MRARTMSLSARSLLAFVVMTACATRRPPAPISLPSPSVPPAVAAPDAPIPPDAVELVGSSLNAWQLVNHTPVTIEPPGGSSFIVAFERLGFDGHWFPRHVSYCGNYAGDHEPFAPGASRPVGHPYLLSDNTFAAGTYRAVVDYRDPRHPAFPSRAEATFDVVGLTPSQAEEVLAVIADPERRACEAFPRIAYAFARTAPLEMLPRLLELSEETVAEREDALVAVTATTLDTTLLRRTSQENSWAARLAAARAVARTNTRDEQLWSFSASVVLPRVTGDATIDVADVHALFRLVDQWTADVLPRTLQRVADRGAREVSVALVRSFGAYVDRFTRPDLLRIRQVLIRTVAQETDADARALYLRAIRDCTVVLRAAPSAFRPLPESDIDDAAASGNAPEGCEPVREALTTMMRLAVEPESMSFVPRVRERRPHPPGEARRQF